MAPALVEITGHDPYVVHTGDTVNISLNINKRIVIHGTPHGFTYRVFEKDQESQGGTVGEHGCMNLTPMGMSGSVTPLAEGEEVLFTI